MEQAESYLIELDRFNISNTRSLPAESTKGINDAISWAKAEGYNHVILPSGSYLLRMDPGNLGAIRMQSGIHFELDEECVIEIEANSSPNYAIFELRGIHHARITGGSIRGDKKEHQYELTLQFVRGGVNADGSLNDNPNWIRSEVLDRYEHPGLLANFRLWRINGLQAASYNYYQYKDVISKEAFAGSRSNLAFATATSGGNGWLRANEGGVERNNKMIFAIPLGSPLSDQQISDIRAKLDNVNSTHEGGHGIAMHGSNHIDIANIEISNCTGDGIFISWEKYLLDPSQYTQESMGQHIRIYDCRIHHCRRQGISVCSSNDVHIFRNKIYGIGYDDDNKTTNFRNGTAPMFGIDIESMYGELNIPVKSESRPDGLELNYRIYVKDNYIYNNARGHLVNADGSYVTIESNQFEGYNIGGIISNPLFAHVKYLNNTFIGCELTVQGDNYVNGAVFQKGNMKMFDVRGAVVQNCKIKDGMLYGSSQYGYLGSPVVNIATGTFTYPAPHGLGNGAAVSFEQWVGKVPSGVSVDKLYYTVNASGNSFQLSETAGGAPITLQDAGQTGFHIARSSYGRCYISNIMIERDWRPDNVLTPNLYLLTTGAVIEQVTVKNYDVSIIVPQDYTGRPTIVKGLKLIEGSARFEGCDVSEGNFLRAKSVLMGGTDVQLGSNEAKYKRQVTMRDCLLQNLGLFVNGNTIVTGCTFINASVGKYDNANKTVIAHSYFENSKINLTWMRQDRSVTIAKSTFKNVTVAGTSPYIRMIDNTDLGNEV